MTEDHRRDLELIAELAVTKMDLKVTQEFGAFRKELQSIPPLIDKKITAYDDRQTARRRWVIRTIIGLAALMISAITLIAANWPG